MVCLGNICRSPMADGMLRHIVSERGLEVEVDGCGTSAFHVGEAPDRRMQRTAKGHGVDLSFLRARQLQAEDLDHFDLVFAMDKSNYDNIHKLATSVNQHKVRMLLDETFPGEGREVPDPYYGGDEGFEYVYQIVRDACHVIADKIQQGEYAVPDAR